MLKALGRVCGAIILLHAASALAACPPAVGASAVPSAAGMTALATQIQDQVSVRGGCIDGTAIGSVSPSTGAFTTLSSTGATSIKGTLATFGNAAGAPTHVATAQATAPALTSCGGGTPTITGTDEAGIVTMGTSASGCVITFNVAYTGTPFCVVQWIATPLASQSYVTANVAITTTQTSTSSNVLQYICRAPAGG
jgi:hypothetical protein